MATNRTDTATRVSSGLQGLAVYSAVKTAQCLHLLVLVSGGGCDRGAYRKPFGVRGERGWMVAGGSMCRASACPAPPLLIGLQQARICGACVTHVGREKGGAVRAGRCAGGRVCEHQLGVTGSDKGGFFTGHLALGKMHTF